MRNVVEPLRHDRGAALHRQQHLHKVRAGAAVELDQDLFGFADGEEGLACHGAVEKVDAPHAQAQRRQREIGAVGDAQSGAQQVVERVVVFVPDQGKLVTRFRCGSG